MAIEEDPAPGVPEWVVTFGDMMSLLLTFFIMLVSMSEIKQEERFQAMLDSMRRQFGHDASTTSMIPGDNSPANSNLQFLASMGRAKRLDLMRGGNRVKAVAGENALVQNVRPGRNSTLGGVIFFEEGSVDLTEEMKQALDQIATQIIGKPQKVEVRGHTSRKPPDPHLGVRDSWDLGYARCYNTMQYLIAQGVEPERVRLGSAGSNEPIDTGVDEASRKRNARVEILMWDERVSGAEL